MLRFAWDISHNSLVARFSFAQEQNRSNFCISKTPDIVWIPASLEETSGYLKLTFYLFIFLLTETLVVNSKQSKQDVENFMPRTLRL